MPFILVLIVDIAGKCNNDLTGSTVFIGLAGNETNNMRGESLILTTWPGEKGKL